MSNMLIKKLNHNTIDVFIDEGWEHWARFKIKFGKESNQLFKIKGTSLPKQAQLALEEKYNSTKHK